MSEMTLRDMDLPTLFTAAMKCPAKRPFNGNLGTELARTYLRDVPLTLRCLIVLAEHMLIWKGTDCVRPDLHWAIHHALVKARPNVWVEKGDWLFPCVSDEDCEVAWRNIMGHAELNKFFLALLSNKPRTP